MLNISEELNNFKPIDVESVENKVGKIPEDMKNALDLYNKALDDIKNRNEDIAIIALKKAIGIYPAFYEAMNLMGICYASLGEEENARFMFHKVIDMDDNSIRASQYLDKLNGEAPDEIQNKYNRTRKDKKKEKTIASWIGSGFAKESKPYFFKYILGFLVGILTMCMVWIFIPENKPLIIDFKGIFSKVEDNTAQLEKLKKENLDLSNRLTEAMDALENANETEKQLQDQLDEFMIWSNRLRDLQLLAAQGNYKEVVTEIEKNLAGLEIPKGIEEEIIALNNECKPQAIRQFYDSARSLYKKNERAQVLEVYQQAASDFSMAISIVEELGEEPSYYAELYYYGGKAIALSEFPSKEEAEQEALRCFEKVKSYAPNSSWASYSQSRINDIQAGKKIKH